MVANFNAAFARDPALKLPLELLPLGDGFPEPAAAGLPVTGWRAGRGPWVSCPLPSRAVHPEKLWTPLIEAFAGGTLFLLEWDR